MSLSTTPKTCQELDELSNFIASLPLSKTDLAKAQGLLESLDRRLERRNSMLTFIKSGLAELNFDAKLLEFDLQATRRERDAYRNELAELKRSLGESDPSDRNKGEN